MADEAVVGQIKAVEGPEIFTRVFERNPDYIARDIPCQHKRFILYDRWREVTCADCSNVLDPYAVLCRFDEWFKQLERRRWQAEEAERKMLRAELRQAARRRSTSPEDRAEIKAMMADHRTTNEARRSLLRQLEKAR